MLDSKSTAWLHDNNEDIRNAIEDYDDELVNSMIEKECEIEDCAIKEQDEDSLMEFFMNL